MYSLIALLATFVAVPPAFPSVAQDTSAQVTSVAALPERLLAHRTRLRLNEVQVERLRSLADSYRFREGQDRVASKPWLRRTPSVGVARAEVLKGLSVEQQRVAAGILR